MAEEIKTGAVLVGILAVMLPIILISIFSSPIINLVASADNVYECQDDVYTIQSANGLLCTNSTLACLTALYPTFNVTANDCQNSTGAHAAAGSGFSVYNESSTDVGLNPTESALLYMIPLFLIIGYVVVLVLKFVKPSKN